MKCFCFLLLLFLGHSGSAQVSWDGGVVLIDSVGGVVSSPAEFGYTKGPGRMALFNGSSSFMLRSDSVFFSVPIDTAGYVGVGSIDLSFSAAVEGHGWVYRDGTLLMPVVDAVGGDWVSVYMWATRHGRVFFIVARGGSLLMWVLGDMEVCVFPRRPIFLRLNID